GLVTPERIVALPGGADAETYRPQPADTTVRKRRGANGEPLVGLVSGLRVMKGHHVVVDAVGRLVSLGVAMRGVFVGRGSHESAVMAAISRAGLERHMTIAGFAPDLPAVMAALDIALYVPLESDGMSRVLFEYLAAGRPVIAARTGVVPEVVADGDVLLASKPRPTSFGVGLLARRQRRRPLILDIDDWELGFFYRGGVWGRIGRLLNVSNPNGLPWTWLAERLVSRADALTVASRFLAERFGGVLVPHVRDTDAWAPERFDRAAARARPGVGD